MSGPASPHNAVVTAPPNPLALRQNSPQDCSNLVRASVDRATVEISRTVIALNATFSKQLEQASISASDGIKAAQDSASSVINAFSQSASDAQLQLSTVSAASSSDVARLSSSLSLAQANLNSMQASMAAAFVVTPTPAQGQSLPVIRKEGVSLTPGQVSAIAIGIVLFSVILSVVIYISITKMRRRRDSYLSDNNNTDGKHIKKFSSRQSSAFRTGNSMVMRFNFRKSSNVPVPSLPPPLEPEYSPTTSIFSEKRVSFPSGTAKSSNDAKGYSSFKTTEETRPRRSSR